MRIVGPETRPSSLVVLEHAKLDILCKRPKRGLLISTGERGREGRTTGSITADEIPIALVDGPNVIVTLDEVQVPKGFTIGQGGEQVTIEHGRTLFIEMLLGSVYTLAISD